MGTDFIEHPDSRLQIGLEDGQAMTIIPQPIKRPFRRFEICAGIVCTAAGIWLLVQFVLWSAGGIPYVQIGSLGEAMLILVQSVYLIGFSINLLRSGHVALVFWMLSIAILATLPLTAGLFS